MKYASNTKEINNASIKHIKIVEVSVEILNIRASIVIAVVSDVITILGNLCNFLYRN